MVFGHRRVSLVGLALLLLQLPAAVQAREVPSEACERTPVQLYTEVSPAVVSISGLSIDPFDQRQRVTWSVGSGVIIDDKGLILTNAHVVIELDEVYVSLGGGRLPRSSVSMRYSTWRC